MTEISVFKASPSPTIPYPQPPFQSVQSFQQKLIEVKITLSPIAAVAGQATTFPETNSNTITLSGYRTKVRIQQAGGVMGANADVSIYGLPPSLMNSLLQAGPQFNLLQGNSILVSAGTAESGMTAVFGGTIYYSHGLYSNQPDVPLRLICIPGGIWQVAKVPPISYAGPTSVATMLNACAQTAGVQFENNGVSAQLSNPYYGGNLYDQIQRIADDAHVNAQFVDANTKLACWPIGGSRTSITSIPLISPTTGMIGYPDFQSNSYVVVKHLFNPQVKFGAQIQVKSSILQGPNSSGPWTVWQLNLALDSLVPKGEWSGSAWCYNASVATPPAPPGGAS